jgi:chromosome segregation ATPase
MSEELKALQPFFNQVFEKLDKVTEGINTLTLAHSEVSTRTTEVEKKVAQLFIFYNDLIEKIRVLEEKVSSTRHDVNTMKGHVEHFEQEISDIKRDHTSALTSVRDSIKDLASTIAAKENKELGASEVKAKQMKNTIAVATIAGVLATVGMYFIMASPK